MDRGTKQRGSSNPRDRLKLPVRITALVLAVILGWGTGNVVGGFLGSAFTGLSSGSEQTRPNAVPTTPSSDGPVSQGSSRSPEPDDVEEKPSRPESAPIKDQVRDWQEGLKQEALREFQKKVEEAKREIEKRGGWGEEGKGRGERNKKGEREKNSHRKEGKDGTR